MENKDKISIYNTGIVLIGKTIDPPTASLAGFENEEFDDEEIDPGQRRIEMTTIAVDPALPGVKLVTTGHLCGLAMIKRTETGECHIAFTCYPDSCEQKIITPMGDQL